MPSSPRITASSSTPLTSRLDASPIPQQDHLFTVFTALSRLSFFAAVLWSQAPAQTLPLPSTQTKIILARPEVDLLVDQLIENAAENRAALPSLMAHESILAKLDEVVFFGRNGDKAEAIVRLVRKSPDSPIFKEFRQITVLNGKQVAAGQHARLDYDFEDDFDDFQTFVFKGKDRGCYSFTLAPHPNPGEPLTLSMTRRPDRATLPDCANLQQDLTGFVRIDPATHQINHLEYTVSDVPAAPGKFSLSLSIDYAPAKVGDKTLWLPTTVAAHFTGGKRRWEWHSQYSDYHQYTSTVTLLPDTSSP